MIDPSQLHLRHRQRTACAVSVGQTLQCAYTVSYMHDASSQQCWLLAQTQRLGDLRLSLQHQDASPHCCSPCGPVGVLVAALRQGGILSRAPKAAPRNGDIGSP